MISSRSYIRLSRSATTAAASFRWGKVLSGSSPPSNAFRRHRSGHHARATAAAAITTSLGGSDQSKDLNAFAAALVAVGLTAAAGIRREEGTATRCEAPKEGSTRELDSLPTYTSEEVATNDGSDGKPVWMTYGGIVYDVTDFIPNHPGGSEKIMLAAGASIEPFWHIYRQHYGNDLPSRIMEPLAIGRLADKDQDIVDRNLEELQEGDDPYAREPRRHKALQVHTEQAMSAELPSHLMTKTYLTPASLFYLRHHHPVPYLTDKEVENFKLKVDLSAYGKGVKEFSLEELKKLPKVEVVATLQCSGNRRSGYNHVQPTAGTGWGQGAISTAKWGGVRLKDLMELAGLDDAIQAQDGKGLEHVRFYAIDGMKASVSIEKVMNPYGDCIVCYEMNDAPLPRDHGFPLRVIVPGYAAVRNVKWLDKIELAETEAEGPWQRGLNYKILSPGIVDAKGVDLSKQPSITEASLFSGITVLDRIEKNKNKFRPGDRIMMKAAGWAWAGGGRNVVRVDCTGDNGKTWKSAELKEGSNQRFGRAWAWTFWECELPATVQEDGSVQVACKAVDMAFNVQPESSDHMWNVRGLGNNSWFRRSTRVFV